MKHRTSANKLWRPAMIGGGASVMMSLALLGYHFACSSTMVTAAEEPTAAVGLWPPPELSMLDRELLITTDLGSGSREFSGVTVNEDRNRLLIVDDEDLLFEFGLTSDGTPITPPRRTLKISAGAGDIEGIAWMGDTTYVLAHEADGRLTVVTIGDDTTEITDDDVSRTVDTGVRGDDGKGLEGVAYLDENARGGSTLEFIVVEERPATLHLIDVDGTVVSAIALDLVDASDVWAISPDRVNVVSDEGRVVVDLQIGHRGAVTVVDQLSLLLPNGRFEQPEGIAWARNPDRLYIVGEAPGPGRYSVGSWQASS